MARRALQVEYRLASRELRPVPDAPTPGHRRPCHVAGEVGPRLRFSQCSLGEERMHTFVLALISRHAGELPDNVREALPRKHRDLEVGGPVSLRPMAARTVLRKD